MRPNCGPYGNRMPEGPEIHLGCRFVNYMCRGKVFAGKVVKSAVSKNPDIDFDEGSYTISATARGKEVKLTLTTIPQDAAQALSEPPSTSHGDPCGEASQAQQNGRPIKNSDILIRFGMSGKFKFDKVSEMDKHAHLNFFTRDGEMVLSFTDYRRFGRWEQTSEWGRERGPCVITEYEKFREHVLTHLDDPVFNQPLCEVLLNQKYFSGIGNYLRAELLYRGGVPPFVSGRSALQGLPLKAQGQDILTLCHQTCQEVINLTDRGSGYQINSDKELQDFDSWLQCYFKPDMDNMVDHHGRTIWFKGDPGPLAPRDVKIRHGKNKTIPQRSDDDSGQGQHSANKKVCVGGVAGSQSPIPSTTSLSPSGAPPMPNFMPFNTVSAHAGNHLTGLGHSPGPLGQNSPHHMSSNPLGQGQLGHGGNPLSQNPMGQNPLAQNSYGQTAGAGLGSPFGQYPGLMGQSAAGQAAPPLGQSPPLPGQSPSMPGQNAGMAASHNPSMPGQNPAAPGMFGQYPYQGWMPSHYLTQGNQYLADWGPSYWPRY